jgi:hypothetical protein
MTRLRVLTSTGDPLNGIRIVAPCTVPWDGMRGDHRVRFCGECRQNVYNVAAMGRDEALALLLKKEGRLCLRLSYRADGTVVTGDCWERLRQARRRGWLAFAATMAVVLCVQIAAQIVGLAALARLTRSTGMGGVRPPTPTAVGEAPAPEAGQIALPPPPEPLVPPATASHPKHPHRTMGRVRVSTVGGVF